MICLIISIDITLFYIYAGEQRIAQVAANNNIFYYHNDHLGTPLAVTNGSGTIVWQAAYNTFGNASVNQSSTITNNFRFPGQYYDQESGLHYNYHRYYDPGTGRYVTSDPIGLKGGINLYAYVKGNPINSIDLFGLAKMCCRLLNSIAGSWLGKRHCYILADDGTRYGLYPENGIGVPRTNDPRDTGGDCYDCPALDECKDQNKCLKDAHNAYPLGSYSWFGPNSNTYAGTMAKSCCKGGVTSGVHDAPGVNDPAPIGH